MEISKHWKAILDTLHDGLIVVNTSGRIVAANPAAEALTGYSQEELVGRTCRILNCTGCKFFGESSGEKWCKMFSVGYVKDKRCLITTKDRKTVHILKTSRVLKNSRGEIIGAVEILTDISQVVRQQRLIQELRQSYFLDEGFHGIVGKTPVMQQLFELITNVAQSDAPVMILGESGTGKEMAARAIHEAGPRKDKPFIKVNCAALNENLLESELFGHVKGAFTGADRTRIGRFEAANEGTIFLDEIGDIPPGTQVKLLRVLEDKIIERVGDHRPIPIDVRIVSATNRDIEALVSEGKFREDLYFRINVFPLLLPRLADRKEDIPLLVQHFIKQGSRNTGKKILGVTPAAMDLLIEYPWPGNIRELRNVIEYAFVLCPGGSIDTAHLPPKLGGRDKKRVKATLTAFPVSGNRIDEKEELLGVLESVGWNQTKAAKRLGVSRVTIWKRMKKYGIMRPGKENG